MLIQEAVRFTQMIQCVINIAQIISQYLRKSYILH